jgi:hypothetical protein
MKGEPNKPVPPNAGIAFRMTIGHHWPGVGEPGRSAKLQHHTPHHAPCPGTPSLH